MGGSGGTGSEPWGGGASGLVENPPQASMYPTMPCCLPSAQHPRLPTMHWAGSSFLPCTEVLGRPGSLQHGEAGAGGPGGAGGGGGGAGSRAPWVPSMAPARDPRAQPGRPRRAPLPVPNSPHFLSHPPLPRPTKRAQAGQKPHPWVGLEERGGARGRGRISAPGLLGSPHCARPCLSFPSPARTRHRHQSCTNPL